VPKLVLTVNHASGAGYYAMAGQGFDPDFILSWPTGRMGVMEGESAVMAVHGPEIERAQRERRELAPEVKNPMTLMAMGVLVARLTGGVDPRTVGSGRTGGTNALRALGRRRAAFVVGGDLLKGALPVVVARLVAGEAVIEVLCGLAAVAGAIWSIFVGFRSGRGVGTGVGTMLVIQPIAVLLATPVFVLVILVTRYVSLGSLLGSAALFPAMLVIWAVASGAVPQQYLVYAVIGPALIWVAHADNIDRLIHGTERKFDLGMLAGRSGGSGAAEH